MHVAGRVARGGAVLALLAVLAGGLAGCMDRRPPPAGAGGDAAAIAVTIDTADGLALVGRLWRTDPDRLLIYLHEYRDDQSAWWPEAAAPRAGSPSSLTFDFRGHGLSPGRRDDIAGKEADVRAAVAFARARGYRQIILVAAGMGAAVGMLAVADDAAIAMVGVSATAEFAETRPLAVAPAFSGRIALLAARDDLSAAESVRQLQRAARVPDSRTWLVDGRAHGADLLRQAVVRPFFAQAIAALWQG